MGKAGRNINNWHWENRDVTATFTAHLQARLRTERLELEGAALVLDGQTKVSGHVYTQCRKKKPMLIQELKFVLHWSTVEIAAGPHERQ